MGTASNDGARAAQVQEITCPLCGDPDCMVRVSMTLAPETIPGEGPAWISRSARVECRTPLSDPMREHLFAHAELLANRALERDAEQNVRSDLLDAIGVAASALEFARTNGAGGPTVLMSTTRASELIDILRGAAARAEDR